MARRASNGLDIAITMKIPKLALKLDRDALLGAVGKAVASIVRKQVAGGKSFDGGQVSWSKRTGSLNRSIGYVKGRSKDGTTHEVRPNSRPRSGVSRRCRNNYGLMMVHIHGKYRGRGHTLRPDGTWAKKSAGKRHLESWSWNPLGANTPALNEIIATIAGRVLEAAIRRRESGIQQTGSTVIKK